jgi:ribonuclease HI
MTAVHVNTDARISPMYMPCTAPHHDTNISFGSMPAFRKNRSSANKRDAAHFAKKVIVAASRRGNVLYTDGSTIGEKSLGPSGAGVLVQYRGGGTKRWSVMVAKAGTSFLAESVALLEAAAHVISDARLKNSHNTLMCDCQAAMKAVRKGTGIGRLTRNLLRRAGGHTTIDWMPSHLNILGNDVADDLAREGALAMRDSPTDADLESKPHR